MTSVLELLVLFEKISTIHYICVCVCVFFFKHPAYLNHNQQHEMHLWVGRESLHPSLNYYTVNVLVERLYSTLAGTLPFIKGVKPTPYRHGRCFMSDQVPPDTLSFSGRFDIFPSGTQLQEKNICVLGEGH